MSQLIMIVLSIAALLLGVAAPVENAPENNAAVYVYEGWDRDLHTHWQTGADGARLQEGPHNVEDSFCTVCGTEIHVWESGSTDLYNYDAWDELTRFTYYDESGELLVDYADEYIRDESGRLLMQRSYQDGVLVSETDYAVAGGDGSYAQLRTNWYEGGSKEVEELDENGRSLKATVYNAQGGIEQVTINHYAYDAFGWKYLAAIEMTMQDGTVFHNTYGENGDALSYRITDAQGMLIQDTRFEYVYGDEGLQKELRYEGDVLAGEIIYAAEELVESEISYEADGSRITTIYNEQGEPVRKLTCMADGSVAEERFYEYAYDDMGNLQRTVVTVNGKTVLEQEYTVDEYGWIYCTRETEYAEDGSAVVTEYNEYGEVIRSETEK